MHNSAVSLMALEHGEEAQDAHRQALDALLGLLAPDHPVCRSAAAAHTPPPQVAVDNTHRPGRTPPPPAPRSRRHLRRLALPADRNRHRIPAGHTGDDDAYEHHGHSRPEPPPLLRGWPSITEHGTLRDASPRSCGGVPGFPRHATRAPHSTLIGAMTCTNSVIFSDEGLTDTADAVPDATPDELFA